MKDCLTRIVWIFLLNRLQPVLDNKTGNSEKVPEVVGDAHGAHGDSLRSDQRICASDLLPGLTKVALNHKRLAGRRRIECRDAHQLEVCLEREALRSRFTRAGDTSPDFNRSKGGDCQGTLRSSGNAVANILVARFRFEQRFDNAGVEQLLPRLK